jgi:hypothetical protein
LCGMGRRGNRRHGGREPAHPARHPRAHAQDVRNAESSRRGSRPGR